MSIVGYGFFNRGSFEDGFAYNYIFALNGVFIEAQNDYISARIPVASCEIRGLEKCEPFIYLKNGKIPDRLLELALSIFSIDLEKERYLAIIWSKGQYHLIQPEQERSGGQVTYDLVDDTVVDLHSHCRMGANFSIKDDEDELGLQIYLVAGKMHELPEIQIRLGIYGYFYPLKIVNVFESDRMNKYVLDLTEKLCIE